jgi:hypothetical protein
MMLSMGISAMSGIAGHQAKQAQAAATLKHQKAVGKALASQSATQMSDQIALTREQLLNNARDRNQLATKASMVRSSAMASAADSGITGANIEALSNEYIAQEAQMNYASYLHDTAAINHMDRVLDRQAAIHTAKQVSNYRPINRPSLAVTALGVAGSTLGAYGSYKGGAFGQQGEGWQQDTFGKTDTPT